MLVFIDESGDPGFDMQRGATPIFVVAMVILNDGSAAASTQRAIEVSAAREMHKKEFKFAKCSDGVRDAFFQAVRSSPFTVRAIVVRKDAVHSPRLRADTEKFYEYFVNRMIMHDDGVLKDARIIIDGSGEREFRRKLVAAMRRKIGSGVVRDVRFKDSSADLLVQLADMCAGAIARSYRLDRENPGRWRDMIANRIGKVWDFC